MTLEKIVSAGGPDNWGPGYINIHSQSLVKTASECYTPQSLVDIMATLRPRPEGRYILLNALGAYEWWGVNRNGDAFPEWSLKGDAPPKEVRAIIDSKIIPKIPGFTVPTGRYGHQTFVDFAHVYVGHANKDPNKSIGDVIASAYNEKMHRAELIVFVYKDRNPEIVQKLDAGEPVPFSMGAKLQVDHCSICLNAARTRGEYCIHLSSMLGQTLPDGRRVFAYNFFPRFFDISYVRVPADKTAWGLRKVASATTAQAEIPQLRHFTKLAEIIKKEPSIAANLGSSPINLDLLNFITAKAKRSYTECEPDPNLVEAVRGFKLRKVLASLSALGIILKPVEMAKLSSSNAGRIANTFSIEDVDPTLVRRLSPFVQTRSFYDPHFTKMANRSSGVVSSTSNTQSTSKQYEEYLKSINFEKLAEWLDTSPVAKVSLDFDDCLFKIAGVASNESDTPKWLPFFTTILRFDSITN